MKLLIKVNLRVSNYISSVDKQKIKNEADYDEVSGSFIYTSFYWCLKRCLDKDENKRILLYV